MGSIVRFGLLNLSSRMEIVTLVALPMLISYYMYTGTRTNTAVTADGASLCDCCGRFRDPVHLEIAHGQFQDPETAQQSQDCPAAVIGRGSQ